MKVVVVGGGINAQALTWRLAKRGVAVVQLEEVSPGHAGSQSGDKSRVVRGLYGERSFAEVGLASLALWQAWGAELTPQGPAMMERCGVLYLERDADTAGDRAFRDYVEQGTRHLAAAGAELIELSPDQVARRYPGVAITGLTRALLEPGAGFGRAGLATRALARASDDAGVEMVRARATAIEVRGGRAGAVVAQTDGGEQRFEGDVIVVAAGLGGVALVEPLLEGAPESSLGIRPLPHFVTYWDLPFPAGRHLMRPALPVWAELGGSLYGFPDDGEAGFKVAWHEPLRTGETREPSASEIDELRARCAVRFPALAEATLRSSFRCTYDATPDENFQVGWVPGVSSLYFVGGMSGHGYKHAPAIGQAVAEVLTGDRPVVDLSPFALRITPRGRA